MVEMETTKNKAQFMMKDEIFSPLVDEESSVVISKEDISFVL